jgi:hypothetical protein
VQHCSVDHIWIIQIYKPHFSITLTCSMKYKFIVTHWFQNALTYYKLLCSFKFNKIISKHPQGQREWKVFCESEILNNSYFTFTHSEQNIKMWIVILVQYVWLYLISSHAVTCVGVNRYVKFHFLFKIRTSQFIFIDKMLHIPICFFNYYLHCAYAMQAILSY